MSRRRAIFLDEIIVASSAVALMLFKIITRIAAGQSHHQPVAANFGHNGSQRDNYFFLVSFHDGFLIFKNGGRAQQPIQTNFRFSRRIRNFDQSFSNTRPQSKRNSPAINDSRSRVNTSEPNQAGFFIASEYCQNCFSPNRG